MKRAEVCQMIEQEFLVDKGKKSFQENQVYNPVYGQILLQEPEKR